MDKAPDAFRTISEVADDLDVPQHVLRFWETRFHADQADEARRRPPLLSAGRRRPAARHPASALRRGLHDPRRSAHPQGQRHPLRAVGLAVRRAAAGSLHAPMDDGGIEEHAERADSTERRRSSTSGRTKADGRVRGPPHRPCSSETARALLSREDLRSCSRHSANSANAAGCSTRRYEGRIAALGPARGSSPASPRATAVAPAVMRVEAGVMWPSAQITGFHATGISR